MTDLIPVIIIGCGDIAGIYDENSNDSNAILTHARAYNKHGGFRVVACVDPNKSVREAFMQTWDIPFGYPDLRTCIQSGGNFDVVSICTPTKFHADILRELKNGPQSVIFTEKPLTGDPATSERVLQELSMKSGQVVVNYTRRWEPNVIKLRSQIEGGEWGKIIGLSGQYSKGLFNCGSHLIDLICYLTGPVQISHVYPQALDNRIEDPTISALLTSSTGAPIFLLGNNHNDYFTFELKLCTENGEVIFEDLGRYLRIRRPQFHELFGAVKTLPLGERKKTGLDTALLGAVSNIHDYLNFGKPILSDGNNALAVEKICAEIFRHTEQISSGDK